MNSLLAARPLHDLQLQSKQYVVIAAVDTAN